MLEVSITYGVTNILIKIFNVFLGKLVENSRVQTESDTIIYRFSGQMCLANYGELNKKLTMYALHILGIEIASITVITGE